MTESLKWPFVPNRNEADLWDFFFFLRKRKSQRKLQILSRFLEHWQFGFEKAFKQELQRVKCSSSQHKKVKFWVITLKSRCSEMLSANDEYSFKKMLLPNISDSLYSSKKKQNKGEMFLSQLHLTKRLLLQLGSNWRKFLCLRNLN